jgi:hypothetical protein
MNGELDSFDDEPSLTSKAFISFASLLLFPISILNFVALPVGAIWLCVLGYWKLVVLSFLAAFIGGKIIGLITLPSFGLQAVAAKTIEGQTSLLRRFLSMLLLAGSYSYFSFVFGAWGLVLAASLGPFLQMQQYQHCSWLSLLEYGLNRQWQIPPIAAYRKTCAYYAGLQRWSP